MEACALGLSARLPLEPPAWARGEEAGPEEGPPSSGGSPAPCRPWT